MNNSEIKNLNLLGHKRNINNIIENDEFKVNEEEKTRENNQNKLSTKKPEFFHISIEEKNGNNLERINGAYVNNMDINTENKVDKNICQKCNTKDNLLLFNSVKAILDYLSRKKSVIDKNNFFGEKIYFYPPKIICLNCLLTISKNRTEFDKFIRANNYKKNDGGNNPFNNLLENPNLKKLSYFDIRKVRRQNELNDKSKSKDNSEKILSQDGKSSTSIINEPKNNINKNSNNININNNEPNNISNNKINIKNRNINIDFLNTLNYFFLPLINCNMPFNQNIANLNNSNNSTNNLNGLFNNNTSSKNLETKENNISQNNSLQPPLINISDILQNTLLNKPQSLLPKNNNDILNLSQLPLLNKNYQIENNKNDNNVNTTQNNANRNNNDKEKISKENNVLIEHNDISKDYTLIDNKSFDELFKIISNLYHKLLDIKINRELIIDTKKLLNKNKETLFSNNLNNYNNSNQNIANNILYMNNSINSYKNN